MTSAATDCRQLADELRRILGGGLKLSAATMHYIDSTLANPTAGQLRAALADEDNCERDPLLELLFSPDEAMQVRLEALLEQSNFDRRDRTRVIAQLMDPPQLIRLRLPEGRGHLEIPLPSIGARRLVELLHLEKRLRPELRRAVDAHVGREHAARVKVIFRNARCRFCGRDVAFLTRALAGLDVNRQTDVASLEYALTVLADSPAPADIYRGLMQRKRVYCRQLQSARKREQQLRKSNPEILMLQGRRIGGIDPEKARGLIAMIDRVSLAVFGRTEPMAPPALEAEYDRRDGTGALELFI